MLPNCNPVIVADFSNSECFHPGLTLTRPVGVSSYSRNTKQIDLGPNEPNISYAVSGSMRCLGLELSSDGKSDKNGDRLRYIIPDSQRCNGVTVAMKVTILGLMYIKASECPLIAIKTDKGTLQLSFNSEGTYQVFIRNDGSRSVTTEPSDYDLSQRKWILFGTNLFNTTMAFDGQTEDTAFAGMGDGLIDVSFLSNTDKAISGYINRIYVFNRLLTSDEAAVITKL